MLLKFIDLLAFSSLLVSLAALSIAYCTLVFMGIPISYSILLLIFFGTLIIYNIDHISGMKEDKKDNPSRYYFVSRNITLLKVLIFISALICLALITKIGLLKSAFLIPVAIIGIFHRRIKYNPIVTSIYITISWLAVVVIFPGYINENYSNIEWIIFIIGTALLANAYTSSILLTSNAKKLIGTPMIITIMGIASAAFAPAKLIPLIFIPLITFIALTKFRNIERYEHLYLDLSLILGSIISVVALKIVI